MNFDTYFKSINVTNFEVFAETSQSVLFKLSKDIELVKAMLDNVVLDDQLIEKSECYDFLDKIICYFDRKSGISLRISIFNEKYANRIHYHRWDYSACILKGMYSQSFYGLYMDRDITELYPYHPLVIETIKENCIYSVEHRMIHSIKAKPGTISMCIRGNAFYDSFQAIDPMTNSSWTQYGAKFEAVEERMMKAVTPLVLKQKIEYIKKNI